MTLGGKKEAIILFLGDLVCFIVALWLTLLVRYWQLPSRELFTTHFIPFSLIFLIWTLFFFIFDLYRKQTILFKGSLPSRILRAQIINSLVAGLFFYFSPFFYSITLTPRLNLLIDLVFSFILIVTWRRYLAHFVYRGRPVRVSFACRGEEVEAIRSAISFQPSYSLQIVDDKPNIIVYDKYDTSSGARFGDYYKMLFQGVGFIGAQDLYEEVFGRVPLSLVNERWFLERVSNQPKPFYDLIKRIMDIVVAGLLGVVSLVFYPFIYLAIKLEDGGPTFYCDERIGKGGFIIKIYKFRSMSPETELNERRVTRIGALLRRTRLDELPQLWSVVRGDQSLIGPRPEKSDYVTLYRQEIPFYDVRHLIAPGLSGWAQIYQDGHPHFTTSAEATREKLSYDLYYIKHRGLWLDIKIALKTINTLLSRTGI
jgi:lipopolysaccharide/colanic/teichoic acid biosynthesis glycosyltransferase